MNDISRSPLVSVIMGTYNGEKYIRRAIESILNQTYKNLELIICDDSSTDKTVNIIEEFADRDNRVVLIRNEKNCGLNISLNNCLQKSKGEFIARMDDDDISHLNRIERELEFLNSHHEYALVGTGLNYFDENGIYKSVSKEFEPSIIDIFKSRAFAHPTVMIRSDVLHELNGYSSDSMWRRAQDFDLWNRLYEAGYKGYIIKDVLFDYFLSREAVVKKNKKIPVNYLKQRLYWRKRLHLPLKYSIFMIGKFFIKSVTSRNFLYLIRRNN